MAAKTVVFATLLSLTAGNNLKGLITVLNENGKVSRSHAIPLRILTQQSEAIGVLLFTVPASWQEYEEKFIAAIKNAAQHTNADAAVFGDIDIEGNRLWEEKVVAAASILAHLPLWKCDRKDLVLQMIDKKIEAIIISCNTTLGKDFLGKKINEQTILELENAGADVCGENGEYHTLVTNCPFFSKPLQCEITDKKQHEHYCFLEIK